MEVKYYELDKLLIFKITDEIDECSVKNIRRKADYEIERFMPREIIFDFNSVTFMDSAGIGMIIGRYKQANIIGGKIEIANLTEGVRKIFEMSGVLKIIQEIDLETRMKKIISTKDKMEVANIWVKKANMQIMKLK